MATISQNDLLDTLRQFPILTAAQLTTVTDSLAAQFSEPADLARELLQRGWITQFQARQLLLGRGLHLVFGPYLVLDRLGGGGNGQVFKVRHRAMNRIIALKVLRNDLVGDNAALGRFHREVEVISQLDHPSVVHAYDADVLNTIPFLALEYVEGVDLERMVADNGPLPVLQACDYIRQAALGLQYAHEKGLVHRDVKPANLLVAQSDTRIGSGAPGQAKTGVGASPWGVVKILDLGLARLTQPAPESKTRNLTTLAGNNVLMGTPDYMAPEQAIDFHRADIRADIYSLGCTLYFVLAGKPPFAGGSASLKLMRHQQGEPPAIQQFRPEVPEALATVLTRMMAKRPPDRYQTPGEAAQELAALMATPDLLPAVAESEPKLDELVPLEDEPAPPPVTKKEAKGAAGGRPARRRRRRWQGLAGAAAGIVLLGLGLLFLTGGSRDSGESTAAQAAVSPPTDSNRPVTRLSTTATRKEPAPVYLSDLPERDAVVGHGQFGKNGNLGYENKRITVQNVVSAHGLSMHPPSNGSARVAYLLGKQYQTFHATATLNDDATESETALTFRVKGDGKVLWESKPVKKHGDVQECNVPVRNVDRIELEVACPGGFASAHAVWVEPRLLR